MRHLTTTALLSLALCLPMTAARASATLGLADGHYAVSLQCTFSNAIACPSTLQGTLDVTAGSVSAMDFSIDGIGFSGDPFDDPITFSTGAHEVATLSHMPYEFLSIRLMTDGTLGSLQAGDRYWVYCQNQGNPGQCVLNTQGTWDARLISTVPEPALPALLALALLALLTATRARRAAKGACGPVR